jgi:hypothetical protein
MARPQKWVMRDNGDGTVDVLRNGRQLQADLPAAQAHRYYLRHRAPDSTIVREDTSGHQRRIKGLSDLPH